MAEGERFVEGLWPVGDTVEAVGDGEGETGRR
jgi:hypothetical protein